MSCLLEQTAHLTFLGIFLTKSTIPLTILSTLAIMPSTTPILVKLICISSFGKNFPQELYLSPNFRSCGISGNRPFTANRLQKGVGYGKPERLDFDGGYSHRHYTNIVKCCQVNALQKIYLLFPQFWVTLFLSRKNGGITMKLNIRELRDRASGLI